MIWYDIILYYIALYFIIYYIWIPISGDNLIQPHTFNIIP